MRIVDLSRELYHRTPSYPGQPPIIHGIWKTHEEALAESGNVQGNSVMFFSMPDHGGTHIDAPRHFGKSGTPIDKYPLENCIVQGICIDLRHIKPARRNHPGGSRGGSQAGRRPDPEERHGAAVHRTSRTDLPDHGVCDRQPGRQRCGHRMAGASRHRAFRIDSMRPGPEGKVNSLVHKSCLELGFTHIESLCNLEALLGQGEFQFIGLPLKWREGTGSPIRAVAVFDH